MTQAPARLQVLHRRNRTQAIRQPAVAVRRPAYTERAPAHAAIFGALPPQLSREAVRGFVRTHGRGDTGAVASFIVSQVWGYGTTGYGPFRLSEALSSADLVDALVRARRALTRRRPVDAYRILCVDHQIPWTGTAFGTKYLHFAEATSGALILDSVVARWLNEHAGRGRFRCQRDADEYAEWLALADSWARALRTTPEAVELMIFSDGVGERSSWSPQRSRADAESDSS